MKQIHIAMESSSRFLNWFNISDLIAAGDVNKYPVLGRAIVKNDLDKWENDLPTPNLGDNLSSRATRNEKQSMAYKEIIRYWISIIITDGEIGTQFSNINGVLTIVCPGRTM